VDLGDLYPHLPRDPALEPLFEVGSVPSLASRERMDLGDLEPVEEPEWPTAPGEVPSLASRERMDLGDLEPSPALEKLPEPPERHLDLSEVSDVGGWVVVDLGESIHSYSSLWRAMASSRRENRYGVVPVGDLPEGHPVSGVILSYREALEAAQKLNSLREVMET